MEHFKSQEISDLANRHIQIQHYDNEIDIKEVFLTLWDSKLTIVATSCVFILLGLAYSFIATEKWVTNARIAQPELSQYKELQSQVSQFHPIFDEYSIDLEGTLIRNKKLVEFIMPEVLFSVYVQQFINRNNKRVYLESNEDFKSQFDALEKGEDEELNKIREQRLYHIWYKKLTIKKVKKAKNDDSPDIYDLTSEFYSAEKSYDLLIGYTQFVLDKSRKAVQRNLNSLVTSKKKELQQQILILKDQAESRLRVERLRSEYELEIAIAAEIPRPLENYEALQGGVFSIHLGADALVEKVKILNNLKNLSIFEPKIAQIEAKLSLLEKLKINNDMEFNLSQYIEVPEKPHKLSAPNRVVILMSSAVIGVLFGAAMVLLVAIIRKRDKAKA